MTCGPGADEQIPEKHGQSHKAGEPENHGHRIDSEDGELVCRGGVVGGSQSQITDAENGPQRGKDEEVDLAGAVVERVGVIPVRNWEERVSQ